MFCFKCGEKLPDDAQFCFKCGNNLAQVQVPSQPQVQPRSIVAPNTNNIVIKILIAICLLIIIFYFIGFIGASSEDSTPKVTDVTTQNSTASLNNEAHKAYYEFVDYLKVNVSVEGFDFTTVGLTISLIFSLERNLDDIGYAFLDINNDGVDELIIGYNSEYYTGYLLGLYTYQDGEIKHIINSEHREFVYLLNDFTLYKSGSSGYNYSYASIYDFKNNNLDKLKSYIFQPIDENIPDDCTWFEVLEPDKEFTSDSDQLRQLSEVEIEKYYEITNDEYEIDFIPLNSSSNEIVATNNNATTLDLNSVINLDAVANFSGSGRFNNYEEGMERPDPSTPTAGKAFDTIDADLYALSDYGGGNFSYWVVEDNVFVSFPYCSYAFCLNISGYSLTSGDTLILYGDESVIDVVARTEEARLRLLGYKSSTSLLTNGDSYSLLEYWGSTQAVSIYPEVTWVYAAEVDNGNGYSPAYVLNTYLWKGNEMIGEFPVYVDRLYGVISIEVDGIFYSANDWYNLYA